MSLLASIDSINQSPFRSKLAIDGAEIPSMMSVVADQQMRCMDDVIMQVMEQVLSRKPHPEDYKDFQFITHQMHPGVEFFSYKNNLLGRLKWIYDYGIEKNTITYSFEPCTSFDDG